MGISKTKFQLIELREKVWMEDIESSRVPEYIEHHESIQRILKYIDEVIQNEV